MSANLNPNNAQAAGPFGRLSPWLAPLPAAELDRRAALVAQQLHRDGVTHNVHALDGGSASRPWALELLPLVIEAQEWEQIEAGVLQRAALLEAMLADLLGPQRLLHEGLLPPALLLRHPGWLRPLAGSESAGGQRLFIIAFDLARDAEGRWCVLEQRTQGPSGLGYVLHNRFVISRQFPEAFRELRVQHIASAYRRLLDSVEQRAAALAGSGARPSIVLLTPGPYSETYFEHAYLARYLGLPLVEGGDLAVRGERLYLKTVQGLEPVHGVLRRVDDDWCDPLELRPDSALGVPGLLQAVRAQQVVLANALGSAVLETPALHGFMPGIAERLLGEPLALGAPATWWCGEAAAWADARARMAMRTDEGAHLVARSTYPSPGDAGDMRTSRTLALDVAAIEADPDAHTVQALLPLASASAWNEGRVQPRAAVLRVYAIADAAGRWHLLPGGMTRIAGKQDSVSMQRGGTSLDTWVLTEGAVDTFSMLRERLSVDDIAARRRPVASRTGENLFWLGRYTERTEQQVRLARAVLALIDADSDAAAAEMAALSALAQAQGLVPWGAPTLARAPLIFERALLMALPDAKAAGGACSIAFNLHALASSSLVLRERLSAEQWGLIRAQRDGFDAALAAARGADGVPARAAALAALDRLALNLAALTGMQTDRMTRDHGWRLLTVGRLLERLIGLATLLPAFVREGALASAAGIELALEQFDSLITFRARYQRHEDLLALADLLVLDSTNPRSYAGVLRRLRTEIGKLPGGAEDLAGLLARLPEAGAGLALEELRDLSNVRIAQRLQALAESLGATGVALANQIGERYFVLAHEQEQRV